MIPKIERSALGYWYLLGWALTILGMLLNNWILMLGGPLILVWAFYSDNDEDNHVDPPGTQYVHNGPIQEQIP